MSKQRAMSWLHLPRLLAGMTRYLSALERTRKQIAFCRTRSREQAGWRRI